MYKNILILIITYFMLSKTLHANNDIKKFNIYSGNKEATFFKIAKSICDVFNKTYSDYVCNAIESKGALNNIFKTSEGTYDFSITKPLTQFKYFIDKDQINNIKSNIIYIAKLHDEILTILVTKKSKITSLKDFNNKIINTGSIGSLSNIILKEFLRKNKIIPKKIVNLGADKTFKNICNNKIDGWAYFIGHPNSNYKKTLKECDVKLLSLNSKELQKLLQDYKFLNKDILNTKFYNIKESIKTVSSTTILIANKNIDQKIIILIKNILKNKKNDLIDNNKIFKYINFEL